MFNICTDRVAPEKQDFLTCLPYKPINQDRQQQEVVMDEQWKDVEGFEGIYQISNHGRLKSFHKNAIGEIRSVKNKNGWYLTVPLCARSKRKTARIHRLVAEAFIPNPENKREVNHKDLNKQNNHVDNLEWATCKENCAHALFNKPEMIAGMNHYNQFIRPKSIQQVSFDGQLIAEFQSGATAAKTTGVCQRNILQVATHAEYKPGKTRKQAGGYVWRFKDEIQSNSQFEQGELLPLAVGGSR